MAITAVAAHLCRITLPGGERGVATLAGRYGHDEAALDQVYDHILECLRHYRAFHDRRNQVSVIFGGAGCLLPCLDTTWPL